FVTAERRYESTAELYIMQPEAASQSVNGVATMQRDQMPNYQRLITSEKVLKEALRSLPKKDRIDFVKYPESKWIKKLSEKLVVKTVRQTNILQVSYQSARPQTAVAVCNAVVN